jgi:hypothetical protein
MTLTKPGTYTAKVMDHAITETKAGLPQATVRFSFEADGEQKVLTWFGSFKDTVVEHTIKGLVACGLKGNNPSGPLEVGKEVSIVVSVELDDQGHENNRIRWVNALGGIGKRMDPQAAAIALEGFSGAVAAFKSKAGLAPKNHAPGANSNPWDDQ